MKRFETQDKKAGITEDGKVFISGECTHNDYLELIEATSNHKELYLQISSEMENVIKTWDWEIVFNDGDDISIVWEERDWLELQIESALEDGNLDRFGEY